MSSCRALTYTPKDTKSAGPRRCTCNTMVAGIGSQDAEANFFFLASAAMRSDSDEKAPDCLPTPVGFSPVLRCELSRPPRPRKRPPRPRPPRPPKLFLRAGSSIALVSSVLPRFREPRSRSSGRASSNLPIAVWPVPKRLARSKAFCASASVALSPVSASAPGAPTPNLSALALRLAISASTSECGRCKEYDAEFASAVSVLAEGESAGASAVVGAVAAGAVSIGAVLSGAGIDAGSDAGSGSCVGGALVDSAGGAFSASREGTS
jgi:hypothetical protein